LFNSNSHYKKNEQKRKIDFHDRPNRTDLSRKKNKKWDKKKFKIPKSGKKEKNEEA
jgi:hypothetical protein